jgi:MoxR-like ATPase
VLSSHEVLALHAAAEAVKFNDALVAYLLALVAETRRHESLALGVSPRGALALRRAAQARALVDGRDYCIPDDVRELAVDVLAHRVVVDPHGGPSRGSEEAEWILREIRERVPVPL